MKKSGTPTAKKKSLPEASENALKRKDSFYAKIAPKSISQARSDIATWKAAMKQAMSVENPRRARLQNLYRDCMLDALLTSQIENRRMQTLQSPFTINDPSGEVNEEATNLLKSTIWFPAILKNILDSIYFGPTLIEIVNDGSLRVVNLPRNNFVPERGMFYFDENDTKGTPYRDTREYGTWLLEFGEPAEFGLLNKAIPHILFKRFAQSCWSELCEIYGIPPRYIKTNTQDPAMLSRSEQMMRDVGAAAWFIIDTTEDFQFAKGADTNGDVYKNLIQLCNNETSMLISGAIVGQDTVNGNRSKEQVSVSILMNLVNADKRMVEAAMNSTVIKALYNINILPSPDLTFVYAPQEDVTRLWTMTKEILPHMDVDSEWIKEKFGIQVTGPKSGTGFFQ